MKVTLTEIAFEAGVSITTVDRVLNEREGVRQRTRDMVLDIARRRGWFGPAGHQEPLIRMDIVLPAGSNTFLALLRRYLIEEAQNIGGIRLMVHISDGLNPELMASRLASLVGKTDAVGVVALDHPLVRAAIESLSESGVPVATLVSDIPSIPKAGYVGIDNRSAGRLAGLLMGRLLHPDKDHDVVVVIGSMSYRGHEEREMGFKSILGQEFPNLHISEIVEVSDDRDQAYSEMRRILATLPPAAIYNTGSGNQGIGQALQEANLTHKTVFIAHDLTNATKIMLLDRTLDAIIDQNPRVEAREVVKLLASAVLGSAEPQYLPRLQVIFSENIPAL
jgi:LacI family transcriptional regulator|tara:strand:+ start:7041 stop:8045 length:1005 start_codon:yes stop_codon:yes gene_type:complete